MYNARKGQNEQDDLKGEKNALDAKERRIVVTLFLRHRSVRSGSFDVSKPPTSQPLSNEKIDDF